MFFGKEEEAENTSLLSVFSAFLALSTSFGLVCDFIFGL